MTPRGYQTCQSDLEHMKDPSASTVVSVSSVSNLLLVAENEF